MHCIVTIIVKRKVLFSKGITPMNSKKIAVGFKILQLLWKFVLVALKVAVVIASDKQPRSRYTAGKAQQLYEDGSISGTEYAKCIHGD